MAGRWRRGRVFRVLVAVLAALGSTGLFASPAHAATTTVVSLTFDDGHASHAATLGMLQSRGMVGTYYINSAMVGSSSYYMTWPQIQSLAAAGNEIGGHTLHHTNLTTVSATTARTEVCNDRTNLVNQGFSPVASFAYPEAESNSTAEQIVRDCGYTSARGVGDTSCGGCDYAETMPPVDAFRLRTPEGVTTSTTLANLQSYVTGAETHGGGWVILTFHGICDNRCTDVNSMSTSIFTAFLDWLAPRSANGTVVRTVGQAMNVPPPGPDTTPPTTSIACNSGACSNWLRPPATVSLSATDIGGSGFDHTVYTTDGSDPAVSGTPYAGPFTISASTTVRYYSIDKANNAEAAKSQLVRIDAAPPTVSLTASPATVRRGSSVTLTASAGDTASGVARVVFTADGSQLGTDTTAPYQFSWNTRKVSIGQHTLTATAYDVAGNAATSAPVTVTVNR